jgi:hypothetical protein
MEKDFLILFDFESSDMEIESFILIDMNFNVVVNRVEFAISFDKGADIFNSYLIDSFGRIFFSTKNHFEGDGFSSKIYFLDIFNRNKQNQVEFLFEDDETIMFIAFESNSKGFDFFFFFNTLEMVMISYINSLFQIKTISIPFDPETKKLKKDLISVKTQFFDKKIKSISDLEFKEKNIESTRINSTKTIELDVAIKSKLFNPHA